MLGMGMSEMALIMVVAILVVPPDQLPKAMRQMGRWYGQIRRAADDLRRAFTLEADRQDAAERYKELQERRRKAQELRRKAEGDAPAGPVAQPEAVSAPPPVPVEATPHDGEPTPNDLPPDSPAAPPPSAPHGEAP
jgi:sec-independent protein translocase protein TatB